MKIAFPMPFALLFGACTAAPRIPASGATNVSLPPHYTHPAATGAAAPTALDAPAAPFGSAQGSSFRPQEGRLVLFACEHGVGRSAIAAAHFNRLAQEKGLPYRAFFRGAGETGTAIPPLIRRGLNEDGFDVAGVIPAPVTAEDVRGATLVVVIDTELSSSAPAPSKLTRWSGIAGPAEDYRQASAQIRQRVERLVELLRAGGNEGDVR